jgi:hypothetical protein
VLGLVRPGHAGDVEVRPGDAVVDEALDELRGGDRAASRGPTFFMSAIGESISRSKASPSGWRHSFVADSPRRLDQLAASSSSLENRPAYSWPRLITIAPVSVARSMIVFGL